MDLELSISCKSLRSSKEFLIWQMEYFNKYVSKLCQNLEPQKYKTKTDANSLAESLGLEIDVFDINSYTLHVEMDKI